MDFEGQSVFGGYQGPSPGELFSSWLCRIAHNQGIKVQSFCHLLWPKETFWNRDVDRFFFPIVKDTILARCPLNEEALSDTFLSSYSGSLCESLSFRTNNRWILPLGIYHRLRTKFGLMYCPHCLQKDVQPYFRKQWRLSLSFCCIDCGYILFDACPNCNHPVVFFRNELGVRNIFPDAELSVCYNCKINLKNFKGSPALPSLLKAQKLIFDVLNESHKPINGMIYPFQYLDILHHICRLMISKSSALREFQEYLLGVELRSSFSNLFENNTPLARGHLLCKAINLLDDWPVNYASALKKFPELKSYWLLKDLKHDHFWFTSVIKENFYINNKNRKLKTSL